MSSDCSETVRSPKLFGSDRVLRSSLNRESRVSKVAACTIQLGYSALTLEAGVSRVTMTRTWCSQTVLQMSSCVKGDSPRNSTKALGHISPSTKIGLCRLSVGSSRKEIIKFQ